MARKKDTPQKAALREMMGNYLKENNVKVKDGTDVNSIMKNRSARKLNTAPSAKVIHLIFFRSCLPNQCNTKSCQINT